MGFQKEKSALMILDNYPGQGQGQGQADGMIEIVGDNAKGIIKKYIQEQQEETRRKG